MEPSLPRLLRRTAALALALCAAAGAAAAPVDDVPAAYGASAAERDLARVLAGAAETPAFVYHFRPGGAAETGRAGLEEKLAVAWKKICARFELRAPQKLHVYVYDTSVEMGRLTGRPALEGIAIGGALHIPLDHPRFGEALAKLAEPAWGRAGDKLGGGLEGGRWYKLRVACRSGKLEVSVDERKLSSAPVPAQPGAIGFGVEEGRLGVRALKVRALPAEPGAPVPPFTYGLRGEAAAGWQPDVPGRWKIADEEMEGVKYGRASRVRYSFERPARDVEIDCEMRVSEGATAEVALHATATTSTRVVFAPGAVFVATAEGRRPITGPHPTMREGFAEAVAADLDAVPIHLYARVLLERGLAPSRDLPRQGFPSSPTERWRRAALVGSFVADLLDRLGRPAYREVHFLDLMLATKTPSGELADLEQEWRKRTVERAFEPAELEAAERRLGLDVLGEPSAWREVANGSFRGFAPGIAGAEAIEFAGDSDEARALALSVDPVTKAKVAVRATLRLGEGSRARILVKGASGKASGAQLAASGAQLLTPDEMAANKSTQPLDANRWYEVALVLEGGAGRIYVDGFLAAEADAGAGLTGGPGKIQLELKGRRVEVKGVAMRGLE